MKDLTVTKPFCEEEYNELLRQPVAVIGASRLQIAKSRGKSATACCTFVSH